MSCDLNTIAAAEKDICYYSGDAYDMTFAVTDENGNAVDLSGKDLAFQVKRRRTDPTSKALISLTTTSGITVSGASNNVVTLALEASIDQDVYYHDLENSTDKETIMFGKFLVTGDVTRP